MAGTIDTLTVFDPSDLESLTGLTHDELWDAGFDLDDMDFGIVSDRPLHCFEGQTDIEISGYGIADTDHEMYFDWKTPAGEMMDLLSGRFCAVVYVNYNGRHYYTFHHS